MVQEELVGGRFQLVREVGAGSMARVFQAIDVTDNSIVAVKVLKGASDTRRFAREVASLAGLDHAQIVRYISHGRTSTGQAFLAMEWLQGENLAERLERGPLSIEDALVVARGIAAALGAAHARGIVHRDLKPGNILLVEGDPARCKLLDFGLVRDLRATLSLTNAGDLLGTPMFMAPEQAACELAIDARVDVYALGALIYACITGRPPVIAPNLVALLAKIVLEDPPRPSTLVPETPLVVDELVARLLAKRRDERPADGHAAEAAIESALARLATSPRGGATKLPVREQRVVSILLASNARALEAHVDATLGSYGGILGLADGSAMIVFDGPESPGDLASRATRYALGLRAPSGAVAVATGRAMLSGPSPMGEVIDAAADLLTRAQGQVRVDRETAGLIEGRFELALDEHGATVLGEAADELDPVRTLLGKPTRCVGRERELAALDGYVAEVLAEGTARAVIVLAEAGIGKTRLAHELLRRLATRDDAPLAITARCESINRRSPFAAASIAVQRAAGIDVTETVDQRRERLRALLAADGHDDPEVFEFLAEMMGIALPEPSERMCAARETPSLMFDRIRYAWTTWLARVVERRSLLLVIEDLHWADDSSILLVDAALAALADTRFMVLALARPEVRDRKLWSGRRAHEMALDALPKRASERLVREALGPSASDRVVAEIVARAEGNALFLEELVRASSQQRTGELPVGVIGTLQRRFDALDRDARAVLRAASIFGERFTVTGVAALVPSNLLVRDAIAELVEAEMIAADGDELVFRHALVREAAYALLTANDRALGHGLAARLFESEANHDAAVIAWHYEQGNQHADAARWYAHAADRALAHNDLAGALAHARRAQQWTTDDEALGKLDLLVGETEFWLGNLEAGRDSAVRATTRLRPSTAAWFEAAGVIITAAGQLGDNAIVEDWLARVMAIAPDTELDLEARSALVLCLARGCSQLAWDRIDVARPALVRAETLATAALGPGALARLDYARAYVHMHDGRVDACLVKLREVAATYTRMGAARNALQATMIGHLLSSYAGHVRIACTALEACIAEADRLEARYLVDWSRWGQMITLLILGERERAAALRDRVSSIMDGQPLFRDVTALFCAWAAFVHDDVDELASILETSATTYDRFRAALAGFAAYVALARSDGDAACEAARQAIAGLLVARGLHADGCEAGFLPALATLVKAGAVDAAAVLATHVARLDTIAATFGDDAARKAYRDGVPWHARAIELHRSLGRTSS